MNLLLKFWPDDLSGKKLYRFYEYVGTAFIIGEFTTETAVSRAYVPFSVKIMARSLSLAVCKLSQNLRFLGRRPKGGSLRLMNKDYVYVLAYIACKEHYMRKNHV